MSVLMVLTNHSALGTTGVKTGWYLPQVARPYYVFQKNDINVTLASPKGGVAPMVFKAIHIRVWRSAGKKEGVDVKVQDPTSGEIFKEDPECKRFLADQDAQKQINNTVAIRDVDLSKFKAIFYAGGYGPMFDLPDNDDSNNAATKVYEANGIVSAVGHGTVGLVNVKLSNGKYLVDGHQVTSFTNAEENAINLMAAMPFPLETKLVKHGAIFKNENLVVSGRVVTCQQIAQADPVTQSVLSPLALYGRKKSQEALGSRLIVGLLRSRPIN